MHERFLSYINSKKLIKSSDRILLAISGGLDSMVMLDLFLHAAWSIGVAHVNHHLRAEESDGDAFFVRGYCTNLNLPFFELELEPGTLSKGNMQNNARNKRYAWLQTIAIENNYDLIATAHHKGDETETFLINLMRGSGLDGLSGIPFRRGHIIRPLLFCDRDDISLYAQDKVISYREDSSNNSTKYLRNRLRHMVIPEMYNADDRAKSGLQISIQNLSETKLIFDYLLDFYTTSLVHTAHDVTSISLDDFGSTEMAAGLLYAILKPYGFNYFQCQDIIDKRNITGNKYYSVSHQVILDRKNILLTETNKTILKKEFYINCPETITIDHKKYIFEIINPADMIADYTNFQYLEADHLSFPVLLRHWMPGDRFAPYGMNGKSQKIKDFLTNNKISKAQKEKILVLENEEKILAVLNYRISESVKITSQTKKILKITSHNQD